MTVRYTISHRTTYHYASPVVVSHNEARLRPRALPNQKIVQNEVVVEPAGNHRSEFTDYFGNVVDYFELREPVEVLQVRSEAVVERSAPPSKPPKAIAWSKAAAALDPPSVEFRLDSPLVRRSDGFRDYAAPSFPRDRDVLEAVLDLTHRIHEDFTFDSKATSVHTAVEEVLEQRRGVCQDFAHVQIACLRSMGLPARYVSGYLRTKPPPGRPRLRGADASHAWVAVHCGGGCWIEFDPTNDLIPAEGHVTVGWGRDYGDVPPIRGVVIGGGSTTLQVGVDVVPEGEDAPA